MTKAKYLVITLFIGMILFLIPNVSHAAVDMAKTKYSGDGSMYFNFTGLELDTSHEYEFGFTKTAAEEISKWYSILEYTDSTAKLNITVQTAQIRDVIKATDTGYITIKDKTANTIALEDYAVDLSVPYLEITNYTVIKNGKELGLNSTDGINIYLRNPYDGTPYYQYEKITDQNVINKYKEITANNGDYTNLESILKQTPPSAGWTKWSYFNGYSDITGYGKPQSPINAPDYGLYYLWIYFSGNNTKPLYGYILVDNLQPEIALDSISLPKTKEVELGKTLTLTPTFSPENTTNKIVTWSSSDESVATVDNAGKITPKKIGSTIITVTSQDGNKKANCTVTVVNPSANDNGGSTNNGGTTNNGESSNNGGTTNNGGTSNSGNSNADGKKDDTTIAVGKLPQTGVRFGLTFVIIALGIVSIIIYKKYNNLKGI